jgi:hypothetical protein
MEIVEESFEQFQAILLAEAEREVSEANLFVSAESTSHLFSFLV